MTQFHDVVAADFTVSQSEKFLFDLHGYLLLPQVLSSDLCRQFLDILRRLESREYADEWLPRYKKWGVPSPTCQRSAGQIRLNGLPRLDGIFDQLIDQPKVLAHLREFMDNPQLTNTWSISKTAGAEAGGWHRGTNSDHYHCRDGVIRTAMLNVVFMLTDNGPEDGCLAVLPGSHKSNVDLQFQKHDPAKVPGLVRVTGKAGDVLIFSESLYHNGLPKTTSGTRTNLYFNNTASWFSVTMYSPEHNHHFCLPPGVRKRFNPTQQQRTAWMEHVVTDE